VEEQTRALVPYAGDVLISAEPERGAHRLTVFLGDDGAGRARYAHGGRALLRADVARER
jgi:hypothetical protein